MDGQSCQPLRNPYLTPYPMLNTTSTLKWRPPGCRQDSSFSNPNPNWRLEQLQKDRDDMESAYQFAKDELMVIKATLAEMANPNFLSYLTLTLTLTLTLIG